MLNTSPADLPAAITHATRHRAVVAATVFILIGLAANPGWAQAAEPKTGQSAYVVKRGDTLTSIAGKLKLNASDLAARNGIVGGRIYAGTKLLVDAKVSTKTPASGSGYVVRPGDTLNSIARKLRLNPTALAARNGIINGNVYYGARLLTSVSASGQPAVPANPYVAKRAGSDKAVRCPLTGPKQFMNDWGLSRSGGRWHQGTDLMARRGTPVVAPAGGKVTKVENKLGGKAVQLRTSDGTVFYFAHMDGYGATGSVAAGAVIGKVGSSGDAEGGPPHLHFEIHPGGGAAVNPYPTVRLGCG